MATPSADDAAVLTTMTHASNEKATNATTTSFEDSTKEKSTERTSSFTSPTWNNVIVDARFSNGSLGYIADPYALSMGVESFLGGDEKKDHKYYNLLEREPPKLYLQIQVLLILDQICELFQNV